MIRLLMLRLVVLMMLLRLMLLAMLVMLMLRAPLLVGLLIAAAERRLLLARREGLGVSRWIRRLLVAEIRLALHRLTCSVVGILVGAVGVVALRLPFRPVIGVLLAELFLGCGNQAEIMFGVLVIILGGHRVARGHRIARQLHVFFSNVGCGSPNFDFRAV